MRPMNVDPLVVWFVGGQSGPWSVKQIVPITGASLPAVSKVTVLEGTEAAAALGTVAWVLRGMTGADHYLTPLERKALDAVSPPLARRESTSAALIPIRKSQAWWTLPPKERRAIFEERSHHVARSLGFLPRIARRLHHGHDLGEPFDFLTWFEYAPADEPAFDELVGVLRATEEWGYVEREVDIRLRRDSDT
jgi:Chlorite dismutase